MLYTPLMIQTRLQRLLRSAADYARVRMELLELELNAERERLGAVLRRGLVLALTLLITLQLIAALLVALSWDTRWRLPTLMALVLLALIGSGLAWRALRDLQRRRPARPLATAFREFDRLLKPFDDEMS